MPSAGRCVSAVENGGPFSDLVIDHCITKSVRDSAAFLSVTEGSTKYSSLGYISGSSSEKLRIAIYSNTLFGNQPDKAVLEGIEHIRKLCEELSHEVVDSRGPAVDGKAISLAFFTLAGFTMDQVCKMMEPMIQQPVNKTFLEPFTHQLVEWLRTLDSQAVPNAKETIQSSAHLMLQYAQEFDVLLCPTLANPPRELAYLSPKLDRETVIHRTENYTAYTPIHNISDMCAMSVLLDKSSQGLPLGSHFAAMPGSEVKLFNLAFQLEEEAHWMRV
ncbi:MAG: amidase [Gammaproteobacteria bacterium]|nr:amidase [Gammaproteobacteria bacterium]